MQNSFIVYTLMYFDPLGLGQSSLHHLCKLLIQPIMNRTLSKMYNLVESCI